LAARIVMGALLMFLLAGLLEGFGRQLILDVTTRYLIAAVAAVWWLLYLTRAGRTGSDDDRC
ncbi:MAG TPA: stage II sporulation protein M, partial [Dehalococcoidia bacterium]|nr:stage II sporulation protein M [Dehalococcoidia bacterium]